MEFAVVCLAGPAASLATSAAALTLMYLAPGSFWQPAWYVLGLTGCHALIDFIVNLTPLQNSSYYSDGAQIYQHVRRSGFSDHLLLLSMANASLHSKLRPRNWDGEIVRRATQFDAGSLRNLSAAMLSYAHLDDRGLSLHSERELLRAMELFRTMGEHVPAEARGFAVEFAIYAAFDRRDAETAAQWLAIANPKKKKPGDADEHLALAGIHWLRSEAEAAWAALEKAEQAAAEPRNGEQISCRDRIAQVREHWTAASLPEAAEAAPVLLAA